jgi:hypothetical protein
VSANPYSNFANTFLPPSPVIPMFLNITGITTTNPMVVTVSTTNQWTVGQLGYFSVPSSYGMYQINTQTAEVIAVDDTNLTLTFSLNASGFDPFVVPSSGEQPATISPSGSRNLTNFNQTIVTVPFHSEGNFGN